VATITRTFQTDDLDGSDDQVSTIQFALDGTSFEIDLSATNEERLRERLSRFVEAARPVRQQQPQAVARGEKAAVIASNREQTHEIREWAKVAGHAVSDRGRISKTIQDAFDAAH
jgi:Lsr2